MRLPLIAALALLPLPALAQMDFTGSWLLSSDIDPTSRTAISVTDYGGMTYYDSDAEGAAYAAGDWRVTGQNGEAITVRMTIDRAIIEDTPWDSRQSVDLEIRPAGPDSAAIWLPGGGRLWGRMTRTRCDLAMVWRQWSDIPPPGCAWVELIGVGYDGLIGDCAYHADWEADWDAISARQQQAEHPGGCLITVPVNAAN